MKILQKILKKDVDISIAELEGYSKKFNRKNPDDFLISIGKGNIRPRELEKLKSKSRLSFFSRYRKTNSLDKTPLEISDFQPGVAIHFAECCLPLPHENIIGITSEDSGIFIHSNQCNAIDKEYKKEDWISASWKDVDPEQFFSSRIKFYLAIIFLLVNQILFLHFQAFFCESIILMGDLIWVLPLVTNC